MPIIAIAYRRAFTSVPSEVRRLSGASCAYIQRRTRVLNQLSRPRAGSVGHSRRLRPFGAPVGQSGRQSALPSVQRSQVRKALIEYRHPGPRIHLKLVSCHADAAIGGHASEQGAQPAGSGRHVKHGSRQQTRWLRLLHAVNDSTKWLVMAAASAALVFHPTAEVLCCIIGSVAAALTCKVWLSLTRCRPLYLEAHFCLRQIDIS